MKLRLVLAAGAVAALVASMAFTATVQAQQAPSGRPAVLASAGFVPACVDKYSETDVLQAAIAASASDIFDRIT